MIKIQELYTPSKTYKFNKFFANMQVYFSFKSPFFSLYYINVSAH